MKKSWAEALGNQVSWENISGRHLKIEVWQNSLWARHLEFRVMVDGTALRFGGGKGVVGLGDPR